MWSSSGLLSGFDVSDGRLIGSWTCSDDSLADGIGQNYPIFDVAIADSGTYVCAVGGPSDRQKQQTGNAKKQRGWGTPVQLWSTTAGTVRLIAQMSRCRINMFWLGQVNPGTEANEIGRRASKRPKTTHVVNLSGELDMSWLSTDGDDEPEVHRTSSLPN